MSCLVTVVRAGLAGGQAAVIYAELDRVGSAPHRDGIVYLDSGVLFGRGGKVAGVEASDRGLDQRGRGVVEARTLLPVRRDPQLVGPSRSPEACELPGEVVDPALLSSSVAQGPVCARLLGIAGRRCIERGGAGRVVPERQGSRAAEMQVRFRRECPSVMRGLEGLPLARVEIERLWPASRDALARRGKSTCLGVSAD